METINNFIQMKNYAPEVFYIFIFAFSCGFATFLNVLIFRMPVIINNEFIDSANEFMKIKGIRGVDLKKDNEIYNTLWGRSYCPSCHSMIPMYRNIPIFSWVIQRGKSACCNKKISPRYIAWEFVFPVVSTALFFQFDFYYALGASFLMYFAIACSHIDIKMKIIPDQYVYLVFIVGAILNLNSVYTSINDALMGVVVVSLFLICANKTLQLITKSQDMEFIGEGDIKLISSVMMWSGLSLVIYLMFFMTAFFFVYYPIYRFKLKERNIPFAPAIMCSIVVVTLFRNNLTFLH